MTSEFRTPVTEDPLRSVSSKRLSVLEEEWQDSWYVVVTMPTNTDNKLARVDRSSEKNAKVGSSFSCAWQRRQMRSAARPAVEPAVGERRPWSERRSVHFKCKEHFTRNITLHPPLAVKCCNIAAVRTGTGEKKSHTIQSTQLNAVI